jgi:hypothetical protein
MALVLCWAGCGHSPTTLTAFRTEQQAQEHCPSDAVVWVDPQSGAYYLKKSASYGHAGAGRYGCRGEAEDVGMRENSKLTVTWLANGRRDQEAESVGFLRDKPRVLSPPRFEPIRMPDEETVDPAGIGDRRPAVAALW